MILHCREQHHKQCSQRDQGYNKDIVQVISIFTMRTQSQFRLTIFISRNNKATAIMTLLKVIMLNTGLFKLNLLKLLKFGSLMIRHAVEFIFASFQNTNLQGNQFLTDYQVKFGYNFLQNKIINTISDFKSKYSMTYNNSSKMPFSGMTLTQIFQIQPLQSLFIKFWYLGLTSQSIIAQDDMNVFKAIKKNITFANCFSFQMPIKTYINFTQRIMIVLEKIQPRKTFQVLLSHLKNNKVMSISFQLFGVAFLQLFGKNLEFMNIEIMNKILRQIFINLTHISKTGTAILNPSIKSLERIDLQNYIPNLKELLQQKSLQKFQQNPQKISINYNKSVFDSDTPINTLKGRLQSQKNHNLQMRQTASDQYPIGQKMRNKQKANLACYMVGGFQIVDYSQSINSLHKKLLTKILLNK